MKFNNSSKLFFLLVIFVLQLSSCTQIDTFEKDTPIPKNAWKSSFAATGSFTIADTSAAYNVYVVLRHTDAYKYNNIWLNVGIQVPGDSIRYQKVNVPLGTDATGWDGSGMNDIWEVRYPLTKKHLKQGAYIFSITQIMRDDPLPAIMSAGLRLEKL